MDADDGFSFRADVVGDNADHLAHRY